MNNNLYIISYIRVCTVNPPNVLYIHIICIYYVQVYVHYLVFICTNSIQYSTLCGSTVHDLTDCRSNQLDTSFAFSFSESILITCTILLCSYICILLCTVCTCTDMQTYSMYMYGGGPVR